MRVIFHYCRASGSFHGVFGKRSVFYLGRCRVLVGSPYEGRLGGRNKTFTRGLAHVATRCSGSLRSSLGGCYSVCSCHTGSKTGS